MKILAFQPEIIQSSTKEEKSKHIISLHNKLDSILSDSGDTQIDLVVLPELSTIECSSKAYENLSDLAETLRGETSQLLSELAKKHSTFISFGLPREEYGKYHISNIVIDNLGEIKTYYDKLHIAQFGYSTEKDYFTRGNNVCIFQIKDFKIGVIICYDFRFPEYVRHLTNNLNVNFILHPVAFKLDATFRSWHPFVITRALENQVYYLSLNRAGDSWGNSILCPPWVNEKVKPYVFSKTEEWKVFDLSLDEIKNSRKTYTFNEDRLADYTMLEIN